MNDCPFIPLGADGNRLYFYSKTARNIVFVNVDKIGTAMYNLAPKEYWDRIARGRGKYQKIIDLLIGLSCGKGAFTRSGWDIRSTGPWKHAERLYWNDGTRVYVPGSGIVELWDAMDEANNIMYIGGPPAALSEAPVTDDELRRFVALIGRLAPRNPAHYALLEGFVYWGMVWPCLRQDLIIALDGEELCGKTWYLDRILSPVWRMRAWPERAPGTHDILESFASAMIFNVAGRKEVPQLCMTRTNMQPCFEKYDINHYLRVHLMQPAKSASALEEYWRDTNMLADGLMTGDFCARLRYLIVSDYNTRLAERTQEMSGMMRSMVPSRALPDTRTVARLVAMAKVFYPQVQDREFVRLVATRV